MAGVQAVQSASPTFSLTPRSVIAGLQQLIVRIVHQMSTAGCVVPTSLVGRRAMISCCLTTHFNCLQLSA